MQEVKQIPKRTFRETILHYIKESPENSRILTIEPADAEWIIQTFNLNNRSLKPAKIKQFSGQMKEKAWGLTGDTIKFGDNGLLLDGQNRLAACIKAGTPFRTHIVFGINHNLFDVMDQGKARDGGDVLTIANYHNANALAAAVRWTKLLDSKRVPQRDVFDPRTLLEMLEKEYPTLPDFLPPAMAIYRNVNSPAGMTAAILYMAARRDPRKAREFAQSWEMGGADRHGKPLKLMRTQLTVLGSASHGRVHDVIRAALAVLAWNLFVKRNAGSKRKLSWDLDEDFPEMA